MRTATWDFSDPTINWRDNMSVAMRKPMVIDDDYINRRNQLNVRINESKAHLMLGRIMVLIGFSLIVGGIAVFSIVAWEQFQ